MANSDPTAGTPAGNPVTDVEPVTVTVVPDHGTGGVLLEIVDAQGEGCRTVLDQLPALDVAFRLVASVHRLRGATP